MYKLYGMYKNIHVFEKLKTKNCKKKLKVESFMKIFFNL